jgi:hypothetical protein
VQDPVVMAHPDRPLSLATVERAAYRGQWYAKGWRSDDDPDYDGTATDEATPFPSISELDSRTGFVHQWGQEGWTGFDEVVVTQDAAQVFAYSVANRRGRFTGTVGGTATTNGPGNNRAFMLREGTRWADSEITSLWWGPNRFSLSNQAPTRRPQMGHVHRGQVGIDGKIRGIVAWYNIFLGPNPEAINLNLWESDGVTLTQGTGGAAGSMSNVNRAAIIGHARRINVFDVAQLRLVPPYSASGIPNGAAVGVTEMTDTSFNHPATVTISSGSRSGGTTTINTSTAHGLVTGDWVLIDGTDNVYDGLYQVTVTDSDTFTYVQQQADDAAVGGGTVQKRWAVNSSAPADAMVGLADLTANDNLDKTAGGLFTPEYPWRVFPYWITSRLIGDVLSIKQWAYGTNEPDWSDPIAVGSATITDGAADAMPSGTGRCGLVAAHAWGNDYAEYGDVRFRRL